MYTHLSQLFPVKKQWKNLSSYTGTLTIWKEPSSSIFLLLQAKHALLPLPPSHYKVLRCLPSWQVFWTLSSSLALFQTNDSQYCSPNSTGYFPWPQTVNSLSWLLVYPEILRAWNPTCLPYTTAMEPFLPFAIREVTFCTFILSKPHIMFAGHLSSLLRAFGILIFAIWVSVLLPRFGWFANLIKHAFCLPPNHWEKMFNRAETRDHGPFSSGHFKRCPPAFCFCLRHWL